MPEAVDTGVSDQELFDQANMDEAPADEAVVEAPVEQEGQPRDEHGRFAGKAEEPEPIAEVQTEATKPAVDDNAAMVPSWRVRELREERDVAAKRLEALEAEKRQWQMRQVQPAPQPAPAQEKAEPPDPLLDPVGYREFIREELREERLKERREESLAKAHEDHKEEFEEAYAAAQNVFDPALKARMQQSRDPGKTLLQWNRERKTMAEVGTDPNAFFEKRFEAYLADPANQAKVLERIRGGVQQPGVTRQAPTTSLPPSLTRATNAATATADDDDISDEGLWRSANA